MFQDVRPVVQFYNFLSSALESCLLCVLLILLLGSSSVVTALCEQVLSPFDLRDLSLKVKMPTCVNFRKCGRQAKGPYARFCRPCFVVNAILRGRDSIGNSSGNPGNVGNLSGNPGNAGNSSACGILRNAGNSGGNPGNAGNSSASGSLRNFGNVKKGKVKKDAGKRSGLRRSAKKALVVKKKWLNLILAGQKPWEIRGRSTSKRGWVHFAESQAGGKLRGRGRLVNCFPVPRDSFQRHYKKHCVPSLTMVPYDTLYAWVFADAEEFERPFEYEHKQGAVIWVDV